jgi:hypothetical protein
MGMVSDKKPFEGIDPLIFNAVLRRVGDDGITPESVGRVNHLFHRRALRAPHGCEVEDSEMGERLRGLVSIADPAGDGWVCNVLSVSAINEKDTPLLCVGYRVFQPTPDTHERWCGIIRAHPKQKTKALPKVQFVALSFWVNTFLSKLDAYLYTHFVDSCYCFFRFSPYPAFGMG